MLAMKPCRPRRTDGVAGNRTRATALDKGSNVLRDQIQEPIRVIAFRARRAQSSRRTV